ncbi:MAG: LysR substrate-binding domain-containing protein, partial [Hyphomicrobiaceae bacterium]
MPRDIDISLLRAFITVVDTGSVTSAARLLNRTQAAVSQQIKRLEDLFGAELFAREHKRIALAPDGERLLAQAQKLVALNDETWGIMTTPSFCGEVRLGVPMDIVTHYTPPILRRFNNAWPHVRVSLQAGNSQELLEELDSGDIDLTLTTDLEPQRECEMLRRDRLVWVGAQDSSAHLQRPLPISIGGKSCRFRPVVMAALGEANIDWRVVLQVTNQEAVNATVAAGLAVTAMLKDNVPPNLKILDDSSSLPALPEFEINLYLPKSGTSELGRELAHHIRADFAARFGQPLPGGRQTRGNGARIRA